MSTQNRRLASRTRDVSVRKSSTNRLLAKARKQLYAIAGGNIDSGDVTLARLTTAQRIAYFQSAAFRNWVDAERADGRQVFWLKDVDKTQAAGDIFTFFFGWRCDNDGFSSDQLATIRKFLEEHHWQPAATATGSALAREVLRAWESKENGGIGIGLLDFWSGAYWPSQIGLTREEKLAQVTAFAPSYASRVYPGVAEENQVLEDAGVNVVIVSNGDHELAIAAAEILCVKPENVVGSRLQYGEDGRATGVTYSYELFDEDWSTRPQPGKPLSFHLWAHLNRHRWGWSHLSDSRIVIAGRDGDSASADGGMMILLAPPALGNFMVDTPGEPERIKKFYTMAARYGWTPGQFFTLLQSPSRLGAKP